MKSRIDLKSRGKAVLIVMASSLVGSMISGVLDWIPKNTLLLLLVAILAATMVYFLIEWARSWIRSRNLIIRVLPENEISVPVSGINFNVVIYNKNKFDVECEVALEFPKDILYVYERNDMQFDEEYLSEADFDEEYLSEADFDEEYLSKIELDREYKRTIRVESLNKIKIELRLSPKQYGTKKCIHKNYIYYSIKSEIKTAEGKISVST
ncbi:MAG: hypothetical protein HXS48_20880 [Theionarchaea archaeon]|nr:hypothetical protein [Theionarchaea archaeon]